MKPVATAAILLLAALALGGGCGYHVAGQADLMPEHVRTIAVPTFTNNTTRYELTEHLASAIGREFLRRTRYRIVAEPQEADAFIQGAVVDYQYYPTVIDNASGRPFGVQAIVTLQIRLIDSRSGAIIYQRDNLQVQNRYEIAADQVAYFDESEAALERVSADVAKTVVSGILEAF